MARLSTVIIFLFLFLFSFQVQAKSPPPGTGTTDIPANILIMLDKSGSMDFTLESNTASQYVTDVQEHILEALEVMDRVVIKWHIQGNFKFLTTKFI